MPKISILIPIYNVEPYLSECLDSAVNQTEKDIEIICVDDASTDHSLEIAEKYRIKDHRVRIIHHMKNEGLCQTRKDGVEAASGEYMLFLDSDDYLSLDACEKLYKEIRTQNVDFIQFGMELIPNPAVTEEMIAWVTDFVRPVCEIIEGENLLRACFIDRKFNCNLCNKIWKSECCKRAYGEISPGHIISAEDRYAVFVLAYYAESYWGIEEKYYHYRIGVGVTGNAQLDLERFEKRCAGADVTVRIRNFLEAHDAYRKYEKEYFAFHNDILWDCVDCWHNKLVSTDQGKGYDILLRYWDPEKVIGALGRMYFEDEKQILSVTASSAVREQFTVGIYYRYLGYLPMEGYIMSLSNAVEVSGGNAVLFSDVGAEGFQDGRERYGDYPVVWLPASADSNWGEYAVRAEAFAKELRKCQIDYFIYASPKSHIAWLDMLLLRAMGITAGYANEDFALDVVKIQNSRIYRVMNTIFNHFR